MYPLKPLWSHYPSFHNHRYREVRARVREESQWGIELTGHRRRFGLLNSWPGGCWLSTQDLCKLDMMISEVKYRICPLQPSEPGFRTDRKELYSGQSDKRKVMFPRATWPDLESCSGTKAGHGLVSGDRTLLGATACDACSWRSFQN